MQPGSLVLMYHAILADGERTPPMDPQDACYAVSKEAFLAHLDMIEKSPYLSLGKRSDLDLSSPNPYDQHDTTLSVYLTFDDSWQEHASVAAEVLETRGVGGIFFLTTNQIGQPGMLSWDAAKSLANKDVIIGSHGVTHRFLDSLPDAELREELTESREQLEQTLGIGVDMLSLPGGRGNQRVLDIAREAGYRHVFGSTPGVWRSEAEGFIPRCVIGGKNAAARIEKLCHAPDTELARLARNAKWRDTLRRGLGNALYHRLHGWLSRLRSG